MSTFRRFLATVVVALCVVTGAPAALTYASASAAAQDTAAVAINTKDGASIFRLAFHVRRVANGVVDQGNAAAAVASCTECQTVALAFQVVLVFGDADTVTPENLALAYNLECSACVTYAAATQLVLGFEGPVRLTNEGQTRLHELYKQLAALGKDEELTIEELEAAVEAARTELRDIFATQVHPVGQPPPEGDTGSGAPTSTTTTTAGSSQPTTTTTVRVTTTTTTTMSSTTSSTTTTTTTTSTTTP